MRVPEKFKDRLYVTKERIVEDLRKLGLKRGDVVVFHSSLKSIGYVEGGANTVIDAFIEVVGSEGTVMVPTFTFSFTKGGVPFHPAKTPSRVGLITDVFWRRPDAYRSRHPTHSVAAIGKHAEYLTSGHEDTSAFSKHGPWGKLVELDGYVMLLGVGFNVCSFFHAVEDRLELPYYDISMEALVEDDHGRVFKVRLEKSPEGHRDFYGEPKRDSKVKLELMKTGVVRTGFVGEAPTTLVRSRELLTALYGIIKHRPDIFLCDRSDCAFCREAKKKLVGWTPPPLDI